MSYSDKFHDQRPKPSKILIIIGVLSFLIISILVYLPFIIGTTYLIKASFAEPYELSFLIALIEVGVALSAVFFAGMWWGRRRLKNEIATSLGFKGIWFVEHLIISSKMDYNPKSGVHEGVAVVKPRESTSYGLGSLLYYSSHWPSKHFESKFFKFSFDISISQICKTIFICSLLLMIIKDYALIDMKRSWFPYSESLTIWDTRAFRFWVFDSVIAIINFYAGYKLGRFNLEKKLYCLDRNVERIGKFIAIPYYSTSMLIRRGSGWLSLVYPHDEAKEILKNKFLEQAPYYLKSEIEEINEKT